MPPMSLDRRRCLTTTLAATAALGARARSGVVQSAALFSAFRTTRIETPGATIHTVIGGGGPPVLLIRGYPQTHVEWHKVAAVAHTNGLALITLNVRDFSRFRELRVADWSTSHGRKE